MSPEVTLARWREEEQALVSTLATEVGWASPQQVSGLSGLEVFEVKLNLVRALTDAVPLVRAEGRVLHAGRQIATAEGRLVGPDDRLYAHATTTCLIFERPVAARMQSA